MFLLEELSQKYKTISIVGMAKNAGKTTALNYLIEEAMDEGIVLGITSTGRDGESTDLVTGTDKPRVFLDTDTIVSVPTQLYELADAGLEILKMTEYNSSIGQIMLCRVASSGYVQIAGPVINASHQKMCEEMLNLGAELGCQLMSSGAEIYRVEESIQRLLTAYGLEPQVFAIPCCLIVSVNTPEGHPITRMCRLASAGMNIELLEQCRCGK